jgi:hypothetical protein
MMKVYNSVFFFGLEAAPERKSKLSGARIRRPPSSPFFTAAEQVGQQVIREEGGDEELDNDDAGRMYKDDDDDDCEKYFKNRSEQLKNCTWEIQELEMYITDLKDELNVINVTLIAAEEFNDEEILDSNVHRDRVEQREMIISKLKMTEKELDSFKRKLSQLQKG